MFGKRPTNTIAPTTLAPAAPAAPKQPAPVRPAPQPAKARPSKEKVEQFNALKMRLHRKLIDKLDLTRMVGDDETLREQVKEVVSQLADQENTLLNFNGYGKYSPRINVDPVLFG